MDPAEAVGAARIAGFTGAPSMFAALDRSPEKQGDAALDEELCATSPVLVSRAS